MNCIRCGSEMDVRSVRGVSVDHCAACRSVWLDAGELEEIAWGRRDAAPPRGDTPDPSVTVTGPGVCPRCQRHLERVSIAGIEIERCHRCGGLFFDAGELPAVLRAVQGGPLRRVWRRLFPPRIPASRR